MIFVYTGNGKGKTTAAIGQAIRMIGYGRKVLMVQFIKGSEWLSGEEKTAYNFGPIFKIKKFGKGFIMSKNQNEIEKHKEAAKKGWVYSKKQIESGNWDLIILDEINVAVDLGLLKAREIIKFLKNYTSQLLIILTGRGAAKSFIKAADLVTEMKGAKHPYNKGIKGERGLEY